MNLLFKICICFILSTKIAISQDLQNYKVILEYKAYWAGFVVSDISSEAVFTSDEYEIVAHYEVSGIAALFSESMNDTLSKGIRLENGEFRPNTYESKGNFGEFKYLNKALFDPQTLKVLTHEQELTLRKDTEYIPIPEEEKFGSDPLSMYLNMIMQKDFDTQFTQVTKQRQFGGLFVTEQEFICDEKDVLKPEKRSVFEGETTICSYDGKLIAGEIKSTKKSKKRKKDRADDDRQTQVWFGKMDGFNAMVPVYTEFPIGWGKVRIYLSHFKVEPIISK